MKLNLDRLMDEAMKGRQVPLDESSRCVMWRA